MVKIYKYVPFELDRIVTFLNNQVWFSHPNDFNDPGEFWGTQATISIPHKTYVDECEKIVSKTNKTKRLDSTKSWKDVRIFSCAKSDDKEQLRYGYYAKGKGVKLTYKLDLKQAKSKYIVHESLKYKELNEPEFYKLNETQSAQVFVSWLLNHKHPDWKWEKELRVLSFDGENQVECKDWLTLEQIDFSSGFDENRYRTLKELFKQLSGVSINWPESKT